MRIPKPWVPLITKKIVDALISKQLITPLVPIDELLTGTEELITDELLMEDRLNDEVREILKKHNTEIERGRVDYRKLFELTKQKIVKERNLIL